MKIVSVTNQKGGTGKTSTTVNLAAGLAMEHGLRVLVVDTDPQGDASDWLSTEHDAGRGLLQALVAEGDLAPLVQPTAVDGVELIAGGDWLVRVEPALLAEGEGAQHVLRKALATLPAQRWDVVLIDCTPSLGLLVVSALTAADEVLIPVELHTLPTKGLGKLAKTIDRVREGLNPSLGIAGIVRVRAQPRTNLYRQLGERVAASFGSRLLQTRIRQDVRMGEAPSFKQPISTYAPRSAAAVDYAALAAELAPRWKPGAGGTECAA